MAASELGVLAFEVGKQDSARFRERARSPPFGRLELVAAKQIADASVLVLELLTPQLGSKPRAEHLEIGGLGDVVVGADVHALEHRGAILARGEHDERRFTQRGSRLDARAGVVTRETRHDDVEQGCNRPP